MTLFRPGVPMYYTILYPCILMLLEVYWAVRRELKSDVATYNVQCQPVGPT